jgi:hypothetical protein
VVLSRGTAIGPSIVPRFDARGMIIGFRFILHELILSAFRRKFGSDSDYHQHMRTTGRQILVNIERLKDTDAFRFSRMISTNIRMASEAATFVGIPPPCIVDMHTQLLAGNHLKAKQRYAFVSFYMEFVSSHVELMELIRHYTGPSLRNSETGRKVITEVVKTAWKRKTTAKEIKDLKRPTCDTYMCNNDLCTWRNSRTPTTLNNYLERIKVVPWVEDVEDLVMLLVDKNTIARGICARLHKITHPNAKPDARGIYSPYSYSAQG